MRNIFNKYEIIKDYIGYAYCLESQEEWAYSNWEYLLDANILNMQNEEYKATVVKITDIFT